MRRSLVLRANPTVRQIQMLLARVERALTERGATSTRGIPGRELANASAVRLAPVAGSQ